MKKRYENRDLACAAAVHEQWRHLCPYRTISTELSMIFAYHRFTLQNVTCILNNYPSSQSHFVLFERECLVSSRLRAWNLYQCAIYHPTTGMEPTERFRTSVLSYLFLQSAGFKMFCSRQPRVQIISLEPLQQAVFVVRCLNTKRMQQYTPAIL